jgi:hypothetical protein
MAMHRRGFLTVLAQALPMLSAVAAKAGGTTPSSDDGGIVGDSGDGQISHDGGGGASITGSVFTYDGAPIFGVAITFQSLDSPPKAFPEIAVSTDRSGRFRRELPPGLYRVTVMSRAGHRKSRTARLSPGRTRWLNFWLPR